MVLSLIHYEVSDCLVGGFLCFPLIDDARFFVVVELSVCNLKPPLTHNFAMI